MDKNLLNPETIESLAELNHQLYCEMMSRKGYAYGSVRDDNKKKHPYLVQFSELPDEVKESNRNAVKQLPEKLEKIGYVISEKTSEKNSFTADEIETLSQVEHDRFIEEKIKNGWCYEKKYDQNRKQNPILVPWDEMSKEQLAKQYPDYHQQLGPGPLLENEREKDREQARNYLSLLRKANLYLHKIKE